MPFLKYSAAQPQRSSVFAALVAVVSMIALTIPAFGQAIELANDDVIEIAAGGICPGFDDTLDADADGVPDGCDVCPGFDDNLDCNANEIPDDCDLINPGRFNAFDGGATNYTLNGSAILDSGSIRLTAPVGSQLGSVIFDAVSVNPVESFAVSFDFKIGGGSGADGMSFALFDASVHDSTVLFGEGGAGSGSLVVALDTYLTNSGDGNHANLIWNGSVL